MRRDFDPSPYRQLLRDFERAALEDTGMAIAVARAASALADRRGLITTDRNGNPRKAPSRPTEAPESLPKVCPPEHRHGTSTTCYTGHSCRCGECKEAARIARAARKAQRN
jgi:hypothetical protein